MRSKSLHFFLINYKAIISIVLLFFTLAVNGQPNQLTKAQQDQDFDIFKGGLNEGHAGLYYFIDQNTFKAKCDSVQRTFREGSSLNDFGLKLRFLISCLRHGHTGIAMPNSGNVNYKMAVLDSSRRYLPFKLRISNRQLIIEEDCSREQLFPRYSVIKTINNVSASDLIDKMLKYMPADGVNQTFKTYSLYNYFYFHYLFELFFPGKLGVKIEVARNDTHYYVELLKPRQIEHIYVTKNRKSISQYDTQLAMSTDLPNHTGYLKVGSFYKGLIEQFGQQYETFLDSSFATFERAGVKNLIVDLRDNEGGGDNYENILVSYLIGDTPKSRPIITVPGSSFPYINYAINLSDDIRGFVTNPREFLRNDSSLKIKDVYVDMMSGQKFIPTRVFSGGLIVLINGGSFSASNAVIGQLNEFRKTNGRKVTFVGEENGGDIYVGAGCAGQSYTIRLPNSKIEVHMPFLCFGEVEIRYPKKRLPDYTVYPQIDDLQAGKDTVLDFAIQLSK
jgi:Peptidase family S41